MSSRKKTPFLYRRILAFSYCFVGGVGVVTVSARAWEAPIPILWAWILYGLAAAAGALTAFLWKRDDEIRAAVAGVLEAPVRLLDLGNREEAERRVAASNRLVAAALVATAFFLGAARYVHRAHVPAFEQNPDRPQHLASILQRFPDETFSDKTIIRGRLSAEPEYSPDATGEGPGYVLLVVDPYEVIPDPEAGVAYPVSEGSVMVRFAPRRAGELQQNPELKKAFMTLARGHAYADEVEVTATFRLPEGAANPGLFDPEAFFSDQDVYAQAFITFWDKNVAPIKILRPNWGNRTFNLPGSEFLDPFPLALVLKEGMLKVIKRTIPHPESAFLAGVTLGMRFGLNGLKCPFEEAPAEGEVDQRLLVLDEFRWSGTSHVLAVSGLHVTIIAILLTAIFEGCRVPRRAYAPFVCLGLVVFCLITGARPSSIRATMMNSLVVLTFAYGGRGLKASLLMAIGVAAVAILLDNPKWLIQPAFSLSFMAVLSLGLFTGPWTAVIKWFSARFVHPWWRPIRMALYEASPGCGRWLPTIGNYVRDFAGAQFAIMTGMMGPLSLYYFTRFSVAGPFANFIAIPLIGVIVQMGMMACIVGLVPVVGSYVALPIGAANYLLCMFFLWTAHASTYLPFPFVETLTPRHLLLYYALLMLFAYREPIRNRWRIRSIEARMSGDRAAFAGLRLRAALAVAGGLALAAACLFEFPERRLEVTVLSVGYGTAIHVRTPGGANVVVDGGPSDVLRGWDSGEKTVGQYMLKRREERLALAVSASTRPEDAGGMASVLRIFPADRVVTALDLSGWPDDPSEIAKKLVEAGVFASTEDAAEAAGVTATYVYRRLASMVNEPWDSRRWGQYLSLEPSWAIRAALRGRPAAGTASAGDLLYEEETLAGPLRISVVHPPRDADVSGPDRSLVLRIEHGNVSFLLAHGIDVAGAAALAARPEAKADVLLLPGHGCLENLPQAFLDRVAAGVVVASYRYPSGMRRAAREMEDRVTALLDGLEKRGARVYRTDQDGAVRLFSDGATVEAVPTLGESGEGAEENRYTEF